jgi:hypothetical protein
LRIEAHQLVQFRWNPVNHVKAQGRRHFISFPSSCELMQWLPDRKRRVTLPFPHEKKELKD